jgi:hypothetical protein
VIEFVYFVLPHGEKSTADPKQNHEAPNIYTDSMYITPRNCVEASSKGKEIQSMNRALFEEKWEVIRDQANLWWSLMADFDLKKVDKADAKFDKFVTMLQVKYGLTRPQAREEITKRWAEYEAKSKARP